jgi:hypothetical protein
VLNCYNPKERKELAERLYVLKLKKQKEAATVTLMYNAIT